MMAATALADGFARAALLQLFGDGLDSFSWSESNQALVARWSGGQDASADAALTAEVERHLAARVSPGTCPQAGETGAGPARLGSPRHGQCRQCPP